MARTTRDNFDPEYVLALLTKHEPFISRQEAIRLLTEAVHVISREREKITNLETTLISALSHCEEE